MKTTLSLIGIVLGGLATIIALVFGLALFGAIVSAFPLMLVVGALFNNGVPVPVWALGFWHVVGLLYVLYVIGGAFKSTTVSK